MIDPAEYQRRKRMVEAGEPPSGWSRAWAGEMSKAQISLTLATDTQAHAASVPAAHRVYAPHLGRQVWVWGVYDSAGRTLFGIFRFRRFRRKPLVLTTADGTAIAHITWRQYGVRLAMTMTFTDGTVWAAKGTLLDTWVTVNGERVAHMTQERWRTREDMTVDYRDGLDLGLLLATLWVCCYITAE